MATQQLVNGATEEIEQNPSTGGVDRHFSVPGGVFHNPAGAYAREMAKWEMGWSPYGPPGRPREQQGAQPYPCRMYRVKRAEIGGGIVVVHSADAASEAERRNFESRGYHNGLDAAAKALESSEHEAALLSAERNAEVRKMSDKSRAEVEQAEDAHDGHLPSVPETPIQKRQVRS